MTFLKYTTYQQQTLLGIALGILGITLAKLLHIPFLANLGWSGYALLFLIHPSVPTNENINKQQERIIQSVSLIFILVILFFFRF